MLFVTLAAFARTRSVEVPNEVTESFLDCLAIRDKAGHLEATRELVMASAPTITRATSSEAEEVAAESRVVGELPANATPPAAATLPTTGAAADADDDDEKVNSSLLAKLLLLMLFVVAELEIETEADETEIEAEFEPEFEPEQEVLALTWQMLFEVFALVETSD